MSNKPLIHDLAKEFLLLDKSNNFKVPLKADISDIRFLFHSDPMKTLVAQKYNMPVDATMVMMGVGKNVNLGSARKKVIVEYLDNEISFRVLDSNNKNLNCYQHHLAVEFSLPLNNREYIANKNEYMDECFLIFNKDMDVDPDNLENDLGRLSEYQIEKLGGHNIVHIDSKSKINSQLLKFKKLGYKKCAFLLSGMIISEQVLDLLHGNFEKPFIGQVIEALPDEDEGERLVRQLLLIDLDQYDTEINVSGNFGNNIIQNTQNVQWRNYGRLYVHPELETALELSTICAEQDLEKALVLLGDLAKK